MTLLPVSHSLLKPPISAGEAKALFALLDAADAEGRMTNSPTEQAWWDVKQRLIDNPCEDESAVMWELVETLERSRALDGTWIQDRWRTIQTQVSQAKALTSHPFS